MSEQLQEGKSFHFSRSFTREDVLTYAEVTGDNQNRHTEANENGELMVHGLLTASMTTKIGGDLGVLAYRMDYEFHRPVYTNEQIDCQVKITESVEEEDRFRLQCSTVCKNENDETVMKGRFLGFVDKKDASNTD